MWLTSLSGDIKSTCCQVLEWDYDLTPRSFVSTLALSEIDDDVIHTAGGDPHILTSRISTGHPITTLPISGTIKPHRTVRAPMRKYKRRVNGQKVPVVQASEGRDVRSRAWELPVRGVAEEEWRTPPVDWGLPDGEGICVGKVQNVGKHLVFFGEG
jgi:hypothetical protein